MQVDESASDYVNGPVSDITDLVSAFPIRTDDGAAQVVCVCGERVCGGTTLDGSPQNFALQPGTGGTTPTANLALGKSYQEFVKLGAPISEQLQSL